MRFTIISGTEIREFVEHHETATSALESALRLIAPRRPNIRIVDPAGNFLRLAGLQRFAAEEGEGESAYRTEESPQRSRRRGLRA
jgi:hypothetical protein